jgi:hypothetical protein
MISLGRKEEPTSTQVYFETSPEDLGPLDEGRVAQDQRAALAGHDVLGLVEAEGGHVSDAPQRPVPEGGAQRLGGVLDHQQAVARGDRHDRVHLAGHAGVVHDADRPGAGRDRRLDQGLVEVERVRADVHEDGDGPAQDHGVGGADEGEGRHDHLVPRLQPCQERRHLERRRAGMGQEDAGDPEPVGQPALAALGEGSAPRQVPIGERLGEVLEFGTDQAGNVEGDGHRGIRAAGSFGSI